MVKGLGVGKKGSGEKKNTAREKRGEEKGGEKKSGEKNKALFLPSRFFFAHPSPHQTLPYQNHQKIKRLLRRL